MKRVLLLIAAALAVPVAVHARTIRIIPANPTAMEFVQVQIATIASCERVGFYGFQTGQQQGDIVIGVGRDGSGLQCDDLDANATLTIGAFPPGAYRIRTLVGSVDSTPPSYDGELSFVVTAGPTSPAPRDDRPIEDLSGIWVAPAEAFTGFAFINSGGVNAQGRANRVTGLWYDYTATTPTWTVLLLDGAGNSYSGQVTRAIPTGAGAARTVAFTPVGNATLTRISDGDTWRLAGTVDGRPIDLTLNRFRYVSAAWPGRVIP